MIFGQHNFFQEQKVVLTKELVYNLTFIVYCGNWHFPNKKFDRFNLIYLKISASKFVHIQFERKPTNLYKIFHTNLAEIFFEKVGLQIDYFDSNISYELILYAYYSPADKNLILFLL